MKPLLISLLLTIPCVLDAAQVSFSWDASPSSGIGEYRVYYGLATRTYTSSMAVGKNTTATVNNLSPGATYYFAVTAKNTNGLESAFSNELTYMAQMDNLPPAISVIMDQRVTLPILVTFSVYDPDSTNLTIIASSSNQILVPSTGLSISSVGTNVSLTISPAAGQVGSSTITITVSDGLLSATKTFTIDVIAPDAPANFRIVTDELKPFILPPRSAPTVIRRR